MAAIRSGTLRKTPRSRRPVEMLRKKRATLLSHDAGSRREMDMETRVLVQPLLDLGMLVRRIVVADQMQSLVLGRSPVDMAQKVEPFDMAMTLRAAGDHRTIQRTHRREKGSCPVALVVVSHRFRSPLLERQSGLSTIQCLHFLRPLRGRPESIASTPPAANRPRHAITCPRLMSSRRAIS